MIYKNLRELCLPQSIAKSSCLAQASLFVNNLNVVYQIELLLMVSEFDINLQMDTSKELSSCQWWQQIAVCTTDTPCCGPCNPKKAIASFRHQALVKFITKAI